MKNTKRKRRARPPGRFESRLTSCMVGRGILLYSVLRNGGGCGVLDADGEDDADAGGIEDEDEGEGEMLVLGGSMENARSFVRSLACLP